MQGMKQTAPTVHFMPCGIVDAGDGKLLFGRDMLHENINFKAKMWKKPLNISPGHVLQVDIHAIPQPPTLLDLC